MSEANWPTLPIPHEHRSDESAIPRQSSTEPDPIAYREGTYAVFIEESTGSGNTLRWLGTAEPDVYRTRDLARTRAAELARTYEPQHPRSLRRRSVFRVSPDEYLTSVDGATMSFHYRVIVAERL